MMRNERASLRRTLVLGLLTLLCAPHQLVAAVDSVESNACARTREAAQSSSIPPVETLSALLANDLDALSTEIIRW